MTVPAPVPTPLPSSPNTRAYRKLFKLASGGMGTVYVGVLEGALGFRQVVALKEAHAHLVEDADVRRTLAEEALLAARIHHANVVEVRDVEVSEHGITLVMPYIDGASLAELWHSYRVKRARVPASVALRIVLDACAGLAAAHTLTDEEGGPLRIVHRDVSPQNLLIGADGVTRVSDFGVAKHRRSDGYSTTQGTFKGKLAYTAPEALRGQSFDARLDVFSMAVVLWELLTMERLFLGEGDLETIERVERLRPKRLSTVDPELAPLDLILEKALEKSKNARTASMAEFASAIEDAARGKIATHREVAAALVEALGPKLDERRALVRDRLRAEGASLTPPPATASAVALTPPEASATLAVSSSELPVMTSPRRRSVIFGAAFGAIVMLGALLLWLAPARGRIDPAVRDPVATAPGTSSTSTSADPSPVPSVSSPPVSSAVASASASAPPAPSALAPKRGPRGNPPHGSIRPTPAGSAPPAPPPNPY